MAKPRFEALTILFGWIQCLLTEHDWQDGGDWFMCWRCKKLERMPR
jgi:hypothetical protein